MVPTKLFQFNPQYYTFSPLFSPFLPFSEGGEHKGDFFSAIFVLNTEPFILPPPPPPVGVSETYCEVSVPIFDIYPYTGAAGGGFLHTLILLPTPLKGGKSIFDLSVK
jgi:hypothetical protein